MGVSDIFDAGKANLSGLLESTTPLSVADVIHKAFIEVDEEGTGLFSMFSMQPN